MQDSKDKFGLASLLLKRPALEILLILTDKGPKTVSEISEIIEDINESEIKITLGKLRQFDLIDHMGQKVWITSFGQSIVEKLRKEEIKNKENIENK